MTRNTVILSDLTHTALGISALSFPLGTSFVASYADRMLGDKFEFQLFKFPEDTVDAIVTERSLVLGFSNYSWNLELGYKIASWAKKRFPGIIVVFGGPNFPISEAEQKAFLGDRSNIDFYIQNEGEVGFVELLRALEDADFDLQTFHAEPKKISNCCYLAAGELVSGGIQRILDVNEIPSPYLNGMLDKFFEAPLLPMIETTRGCPFSCAFCADGLTSKNRIVRFDNARTRDELDYICRRIKNVDELIITDLNFGMYKQDRITAAFIAGVQTAHQWPRIISASAGKNQPARVIETATVLNGTWELGSAVQSTDDEVLKNIKRGNISTDAYRAFIDFANQQSRDSQSYTEIILALPGDTKEKHFNSLRTGVETQVSNFRMYQAILLLGTSMASQETREEFELQTKFRILPGCIGNYRFDDETVAVAEIEEIIVGHKDMPFEDYVSCRVMNLLVETYMNNGLFEEIFAALRELGIETFDVLVELHENTETFPARIREILESFVRETKDDLYETRAAAEAFALDPDNLARFATGELGKNELLEYRAQMYLELEDVADILLNAVQRVLEKQGLWSPHIANFFDQVKFFIICQKSRIHENFEPVEEKFDYDFVALSADGFQTDPRRVSTKPNQVALRFFHTDTQTTYISNAVALYENHPGGISRMIQRNNLKMMYRNFERA